MKYQVSDALKVLSIWFQREAKHGCRLSRKSVLRCRAVGLVNHDRMLTGSREVFSGIFTKRVDQ